MLPLVSFKSYGKGISSQPPRTVLVDEGGMRESWVEGMTERRGREWILSREFTTPQTANDWPSTLSITSYHRIAFLYARSRPTTNPISITTLSIFYTRTEWCKSRYLVALLTKSCLLNKADTHSLYLIQAFCCSHCYWSLQSALNKLFFLLCSKGQILSLNGLLPITPATWLHSFRGRNSV